ncbi:MAG: hypothetical protein JOZ55_07580 [Alphaproteobacteria bacterium]|nr:hypothetical protein [Alphaproteobacteria bacterium]
MMRTMLITRRIAAALALFAGLAGVAKAAPLPMPVSLTVNGESRSAFFFVPAHGTSGAPVPLVLGFHGGGGNAEGYLRQSHLAEKALAAGFAVIAPQGTAFLGNHRLWNSGPEYVRAARNADDVSFVRALIETAAQRMPLDRKRIFATGFSNGAQLCYRLALELSGEIAAIAPMSGARLADGEHPDRPVPVLHIHGTADSVYPLEGGLGAHSIGRVPHAPVNPVLAEWIGFDHAAAMPALSAHAGWREALHEGPAPVGLVLVEGMGHQIAGGDDDHLAEQAMRSEPDAIALALAFFAAHPMP